MRKIINSTYISLDGVIERLHEWQPWIGPRGDKGDEIQTELLLGCDALIMGRRTYEGFAPVWPTRSGDPASDHINSMRKYVVSSTLTDPEWNNTSVLRGDPVEEIRRLKEAPGRDIVQYGFGQLSHTLMQQGLLDELRLWVHPVFVGKGEPDELIRRDGPGALFDLVDATSLQNGVVILSYRYTEKRQRSVLLIGKSRRVLDDAVAGLRDLGHQADGTNDFSDITGRFDVAKIDLVVFGGQVPSERKAELREEIAAINPQVIFVQGLAGIPGLIVKQVQGAFTAHQQELDRAPIYAPQDRSIRVSLAQPAHVNVSVWWQTSFVPPDPRSDSLVLLDRHLAGGDHTVAVPEHIPPRAAFATVQVDSAIYALSIATDQ